MPHRVEVRRRMDRCEDTGKAGVSRFGSRRRNWNFGADNCGRMRIERDDGEEDWNWINGERDRLADEDAGKAGVIRPYGSWGRMDAKEGEKSGRWYWNNRSVDSAAKELENRNWKS